MSGSSPKSISISGVETDITIGKELAAVAQKSKALASRDCFEQLEMYLHGRSHDRVSFLACQTGKNTMLRQAIGRMTKEDLSRTAYIKARRMRHGADGPDTESCLTQHSDMCSSMRSH